MVPRKNLTWKRILPRPKLVRKHETKIASLCERPRCTAEICTVLKGAELCRAHVEASRSANELRVVNDEVVSPTAATEIARQIVMLSLADNFGLYHATAEGKLHAVRICKSNIRPYAR